MGIAFHPTTGLQGVFRVRSDEAESFTVGRIDAAMGSKIVTDQRHVYPTSDMLFCGSRDEAATLAIHLNDRMENIGARRLQTVMTTLLEDILFDLPDRASEKFVVDRDFVRGRLMKVAEDEDLSRYIL